MYSLFTPFNLLPFKFIVVQPAKALKFPKFEIWIQDFDSHPSLVSINVPLQTRMTVFLM